MKKRILSLTFCTIMAALILPVNGAGSHTLSVSAAEALETQDASEMPEMTETPAASGIPEAETESLEINTSAGEVIPGNSLTNAYLIPLNTKVFGTVKGGEYAWFAFTTGDEAGAVYNVSFVNETTGSDSVIGYLFDEYGTELEENASNYYADNDGVPATISSSSLAPDTTYYVRLQSRQDSEDLDYSLIVKNPADKLTPYKTLGASSETEGAAVQDGDTVTAGSNINDALELSLDARVHGTVSGGGAAWFSFTTDAQAGAVYNVSFVNETPSSDSLIGCLFDEYGTELEENASSYYAESDGTPETITSASLEPNTTYYVMIYPRQDDETIDYSIMVKASDEGK